MPSARLELDNDAVWRGRDVRVRVVTEWDGEPGALVVVPVEYPPIEGTDWHGHWLSSERIGLALAVADLVKLRLEARHLNRMPRGRGERVLAVGHQAKEMVGRTPGSIRAVRPNGVTGTALQDHLNRGGGS